jgi:uncharacterized membrane protein YfcA
MTTVVELLLGAGVGLFLGLFGGGGSVVAVPIFVYALGYGAREAVAMSLVVVGLTSLVGAARAWRAGDVRPRPALMLGAVAMTGAYAGARVAAFVSEGVQLGLFATVLLCSAGLMLVRRRADTGSVRGAARPPAGRIVLAGVAVGVLTGLVGVGGGFLVVPALVLLGVPMSGAVGSSLVVIAMNAAAGVMGYLGHVELSWAVLSVVTSAAIAGLFGGGRLASLIPPAARRRAFAGFLLVIGAFVLYQNRDELVHSSSGPELLAPIATP